MRKTSLQEHANTHNWGFRQRSGSDVPRTTGTGTYAKKPPRGPLLNSIINTTTNDNAVSLSTTRPKTHQRTISESIIVPTHRLLQHNVQPKELHTGPLKIRVIKCKKVIENKYNTTGKQRGLCLIINNIDFEIVQMKRRDGAEVDEENLEELMKQLNIKTKTYRNLKAEDMKRKIKDFSTNPKLKQVDICIVIILSHGHLDESEKTVISGVDNKDITIADITQHFIPQNCINLAQKPKIFILQNCRGDDMLPPRVQTDSKKKTIGEDMLIAHSTLPEHTAFRDINKGSFFIETLCKVFMEDAHSSHVAEMLIKVGDILKENERYRQVPSYESNGFSKCYLNPI